MAHWIIQVCPLQSWRTVWGYVSLFCIPFVWTCWSGSLFYSWKQIPKLLMKCVCLNDITILKEIYHEKYVYIRNKSGSRGELWGTPCNQRCRNHSVKVWLVFVMVKMSLGQSDTLTKYVLFRLQGEMIHMSWIAQTSGGSCFLVLTEFDLLGYRAVFE